MIRMATMGIPPLALTGAVFGAFLSGAGPTIIAMVDKEDKTYYSRACMYFAERFPNWKPVLLSCDEVGALGTPTEEGALDKLDL